MPAIAVCGANQFVYGELQQNHQVLEEVVVTARRSEESLQSTPLTINSISEEQLREKTMSNPEDIQIGTPGVFFSGTASRQNVIYQIRGQAKSVFGTNSPAVASYFAEVPDPPVGSFVPQYDIESVQILKGPQGTLFGRNTTGGAILYTPKRPSYDYEGYISGIFGNLDKREFQGAVNIPIISEKASIRIAGNIDDRDPFTKNLGGNSKIDDIDSKAIRGSLLVEPVEWLSNVLIYDYYHSDSGGSASIIKEINGNFSLLDMLGLRESALDQLSSQRKRGPYKTVSSVDSNAEKNRRVTAVNRTEFDLSGVTITNIFGYRKTDLTLALNVDGLGELYADGTGELPAGTPVSYIKSSLNDAVAQTSNELQIKGDLLDKKLDWLAGFFWLKSEPDGPQGSAVAFAQIPGMPLTAPAYNFIEEESKAVFASFSYDFSQFLDGVSVDLGIRYTKDSTESCTGSGVNISPVALVASSDQVTQGDCLAASDNVVNASINRTKSDELTWSAGINWQASEDLFAYIVARRGYRSGGVNGPTFSGRLKPYQSFSPETVSDIEVGIKSDIQFREILVRANLSAYIGRYDDVQSGITGVQTSALCNPLSPDNPPGISPDGDCDFANDPAGGTMLINSGKSEVSGFDYDIQMALAESLLITFAGTYIDTKTRRYDMPDIFSPYSSNQEIPFDLTAKKSYTVGLRYSTPAGMFADEAVINVNHYWTDDSTFSGATLSGYSISNLRIDLNGFVGRSLDVGFFVRNMFDKEYVVSGSSAGDFVGITSVIFGPPRMFGAEVRYRF
ncbi:MAG: TonB-dependent receptor [Porticoccaceae bacterium]